MGFLFCVIHWAKNRTLSVEMAVLQQCRWNWACRKTKQEECGCWKEEVVLLSHSSDTVALSHEQKHREQTVVGLKLRHFQLKWYSDYVFKSYPLITYCTSLFTAIFSFHWLWSTLGGQTFHFTHWNAISHGNFSYFCISMPQTVTRG